MPDLKSQRRQQDVLEPDGSRWPLLVFFMRLTKLFFGGSLLLALILSRGLSESVCAAGGQPFVIHETFEQHPAPASPHAPSTHGIVGLDLLIQRGHYPLVHSVFRGTPAANQGVLPGDVILSINGAPTLGKNVNQVDAMISDVPGDPVSLTVQRGPQRAQVRLVVADLETLSPHLRSDFSALFGNEP
jgi:membrane-associated protease RseP (regulator of RpoE activity)